MFYTKNISFKGTIQVTYMLWELVLRVTSRYVRPPAKRTSKQDNRDEFAIDKIYSYYYKKY